MRWLLRVNIIIFILVTGVAMLPVTMEGMLIERIIRSVVELSAIIVLPGLNLVACLSILIRRNFSLRETFALAATFNLFFVPLLLFIEFNIFGNVFPTLPLLNAIIIFIIFLGTYFTSTTRHSRKRLLLNSLNTASIKALLFSRDFLFPFGFYLLVVISIVTAFYPLPDLDPYYWYSEFQNLFSKGNLSGYRPLFSALVYIFTLGSHIDFYASFKYVLPFLLLSLLFPLILLSSLFSQPLHRTIILLFPFVSSINIVYLTLPIPQEIAGIATFFLVIFALYSWMQKDSFFLFIGGSVISLGYWYHEVVVLPMAAWAITITYHFRREIFAYAKNNRVATILIIVLLLQYCFSPIQFLISEIHTQFSTLANFHTNFLFPQQYINIDGNEMGWGDLTGVAKYYAFYVGPVLFTLLIALLFSRKKLFQRNLFFSKYPAPLTLSFFLFFCIAEILPRLSNVALLPDRAWVFAGIFSLVLIPPLFKTALGNKKVFLCVLVAGFSINIGAAVFINTLKKYTVTEPQLTSAFWINEHLPKHRLIFAISDYKPLLRLYGGSEVIPIADPNFFYDKIIFKKELEAHDRLTKYMPPVYTARLNQLRQAIAEIEQRDPLKDRSEVDSLLQEGIDSLSDAQSILRESKSPSYSENQYVYYATPDLRNPYLSRPYMKKFINKEDWIFFNHDSSHFETVYADTEHHIFLWKIL
ncbi:MAG: hypothetical protein WBC29_03960 [Candidatus Moraniibacteriota bacterium]